MSASSSPKDPPAFPSAREELSSPDDGDARGAPGDIGIRAAARVIDVIFLVGLGVGVAFAVTLVLAGMARSGSIAPTWQTKITTITLGSFGWGILGNMVHYTLSEVVKVKSTDLPPKSAIPGILVGILATGAITALSVLVKLR